VWLDSNGFSEGPPYRLVDNEYSLLDKTDLVFIDPVSTGFSRTIGEEDPHQFHGVEEDVRSVGEFIRLYTTRYERWASPKFLIGESYGTTRAAGLSGYLQDERGLFLNGIMLVSSILNFGTTDFGEGNDLPHVLFLPTYTATAWYHKRLPADLQGDLQKALRESEAFAATEYTRALFEGDKLSAADSAMVIAKLARLTGLSGDYIRQTNMRVWIWRFCKELLRDQRRTVGRLDSRFTGVSSDAAGDGPDYDPSMSGILGPYSATLNDYVRRELKFESDLPYEILTGKVHPWSYKGYENAFVNVATTLRDAMNQNPHLKVWVAAGYYDLATPYFASEYTFAHLGLEPESRDRVSIDHYEAGHMMYVHIPSLVKMKADMAAFIDSAVPKR
jgi:carboxypeptidase C (cathepsin A)